MNARLKKIKARCKKATSGPMDYSGYCMIDGAIHVGTIGPKGKTGINFTDDTSCDRLVLDVCCRGEKDKQAISDADFYSHAQVDMTYLLTALDKSLDREKKLVETIEAMRNLSSDSSETALCPAPHTHHFVCDTDQQQCMEDSDHRTPSKYHKCTICGVSQFDAAQQVLLCEDEGCPHHGTPHVCISHPNVNGGRGSYD